MLGYTIQSRPAFQAGVSAPMLSAIEGACRALAGYVAPPPAPVAPRAPRRTLAPRTPRAASAPVPAFLRKVAGVPRRQITARPRPTRPVIPYPVVAVYSSRVARAA